MINKSIFTLFVLLFAASVTFAQKGSWYVGGQLGFNSKTESNTGTADIKTTTWNVAPEVGTFLQNNLQLGFAVNLGGTDAPNLTSTTFAPVLYLRRFYPVGDKFSLFTGIVGNFKTGSEKLNGEDGTVSGWGLPLALGAASGISKTFTLVGQYGLLGYSYEEVKFRR